MLTGLLQWHSIHLLIPDLFPPVYIKDKWSEEFLWLHRVYLGPIATVGPEIEKMTTLILSINRETMLARLLFRCRWFLPVHTITFWHPWYVPQSVNYDIFKQGIISQLLNINWIVIRFSMQFTYHRYSPSFIPDGIKSKWFSRVVASDPPRYLSHRPVTLLVISP